MSVSELADADLHLMRERLFAWMSSDGGLLSNMIPPAQHSSWDETARRSWVQSLVAQALSGNDDAQTRVLTREAAAALRRQAHECGKVVVKDDKTAMVSADLVGHMIAELKTVWDLLETNSEVNYNMRMVYVNAHLELLTVYVLCTLLVAFTAGVADASLDASTARELFHAVIEANLVPSKDSEMRPAELGPAMTGRAHDMSDLFVSGVKNLSPEKTSSPLNLLSALSNQFSVASAGSYALYFLDEAEVDDCWLVHMLKLEQDVAGGELVRRSELNPVIARPDVEIEVKQPLEAEVPKMRDSSEAVQDEPEVEDDAIVHDEDEGVRKDIADATKGPEVPSISGPATPKLSAPRPRTRRLSQSKPSEKASSDEETDAKPLSNVQSRRTPQRQFAPAKASESSDSGDEDFSPSQAQDEEEASESVEDPSSCDHNSEDITDAPYRGHRRKSLYVAGQASGVRRGRSASAKKPRRSFKQAGIEESDVAPSRRRTRQNLRNPVPDTQDMLDMYDDRDAGVAEDAGDEAEDVEESDASIPVDASDEDDYGHEPVDANGDADHAVNKRNARARRESPEASPRGSPRLSRSKKAPRSRPAEAQDFLDRYNDLEGGRSPRRPRRRTKSLDRVRLADPSTPVQHPRSVQRPRSVERSRKRSRTTPKASKSDSRPKKLPRRNSARLEQKIQILDLVTSESEKEERLDVPADLVYVEERRSRAKRRLTRARSTGEPSPHRPSARRLSLNESRPRLRTPTRAHPQSARPARAVKRNFVDISDDSDDSDYGDDNVDVSAATNSRAQHARRNERKRDGTRRNKRKQEVARRSERNQEVAQRSGRKQVARRSERKQDDARRSKRRQDDARRSARKQAPQDVMQRGERKQDDDAGQSERKQDTAHRVRTRRSPEGVGARVSPRRAGLRRVHLHDNRHGFTTREDIRLVELIQQYGYGKWQAIVSAGQRSGQFQSHRTKSEVHVRALELAKELHLVAD